MLSDSGYSTAVDAVLATTSFNDSSELPSLAEILIDNLT